MKTQALIEQFKTWNGNLWLANHLSFLKGSFQMKDVKYIPQEQEEEPKRVKQRPYVKKEQSRRDEFIQQIGRRQGIKLHKIVNAKERTFHN